MDQKANEILGGIETKLRLAYSQVAVIHCCLSNRHCGSQDLDFDGDNELGLAIVGRLEHHYKELGEILQDVDNLDAHLAQLTHTEPCTGPRSLNLV